MKIFAKHGRVGGVPPSDNGGVGRRAFLGLSIASAAGVASLGCSSGGNDSHECDGPVPRRYKIEGSEVVDGSRVDTWVVHRRSKVVHYVGPCDAHLPVYKNRERHSSLSAEYRLDPRREGVILVTLAQAASKLGDPDKALRILDTLRTREPWNVHVVDQMGGILGARGRRKELANLYEDTLDRLSRAPVPERNRRKAHRAGPLVHLRLDALRRRIRKHGDSGS